MTTPSATKVTSEPASPPRTANQPEDSYSTGKKSSTPQSIRLATSSNARSLISRLGSACTPTTADLSAPTPQPSTPFEHSTSSNYVSHKPLDTVIIPQAISFSFPERAPHLVP